MAAALLAALTVGCAERAGPESAGAASAPRHSPITQAELAGGPVIPIGDFADEASALAAARAAAVPAGGHATATIDGVAFAISATGELRRVTKRGGRRSGVRQRPPQ